MNRVTVATKRALAVRKTPGSMVWASRKPDCPNAGPMDQRETTLKRRRIAERSAAGRRGHWRPARAMARDQTGGSRMTRWWPHVTEDSKGSRGRKAAARTSAGWPRVVHHHQKVRATAVAMTS